jgi:hypothetical protein
MNLMLKKAKTTGLTAVRDANVEFLLNGST